MSETNPYAAVSRIFERVRGMDAPLNQRLEILAEAVRDGAPSFAPAVETLVGRLIASGCGRGAPDVGEVLPPFLLPDVSGRLVGLNEVVARGPAVVSFYRGHWCPYCRLTATAFAGLQDLVGPSHMVAITPETARYNRRLGEMTGMTYAVLTDADCGYALSLNLAFWVDDKFADLLRAIDTDLAAYQAGRRLILPIPATFVVNSRGVIVSRHIDPDYRHRMEIDDLLAAYQAAD